MKKIGLLVMVSILAVGVTGCILTFDDGTGGDTVYTSTTSSTSTTSTTSTTTTTTTTVPGETEPNDVHTAADGLIRDGYVYGTLNTESDVDFYSFELLSGTTVTVETAPDDRYPTDTVDTFLQMYDPPATTELANNDNGGAGLYSQVSYTISVSGTYYFKVSAYATASDKIGRYKITLSY